jgi:hypothetical protein
MYGGLHHYGVTAYREHYEPASPSFRYGDRGLVRGLWYYDDGYEGNQKYDQKIKALLKKRKQAH